MINTVAIYLWGQHVGAMFWDEKQNLGVFEYTPKFLKSGLEISPFYMPLAGSRIFSFPEHIRSASFNGLPGLLADALPDRFGNEILRAWLARRGVSANSLNPAARLSYMGNRGMGALEFKPAEHSRLLNRSVDISLEEMTSLCEDIIRSKEKLDVSISKTDERNNAQAMNDILRIGSSAGGAKPKAIIAMNDAGHVISGQVEAPEGYKHWMIKFDIAGDFDRGKNNGIPEASGRIEYAYYLMAKAAGININECRLLEIEERGHFLTERFDRVGNDKVHVQTLAAIEHLDRDMPHDYAQLFLAARKLNLGMPAAHEIYRRMVFNDLTFNHDDHTKNHAFMMDRDGEWSLTPAYDVTYAFDPTGKWTRQHQMSVVGKNDDIMISDLLNSAKDADITSRHAKAIIEDVQHAVAQWARFADASGLDERSKSIIQKLLNSKNL